MRDGIDEFGETAPDQADLIAVEEARVVDQAPPLITSTQVKISFVSTQKRVLLVTSFQAHMHSLGETSDPALMSQAGPP